MNILSYSKKLARESEIDENLKIVGCPFHEIFPEFPEELRTLNKDSFDGISYIEKSEKYSCASKRAIWYKWKVYFWNDDNEEADRFTIVRDDITESKRNEELLAKSLSVARIGGWEYDLVANTLYWTDVTKEIHEVGKDYIPNLEEGINFYKPGEDRVKIAALVGDAIREGKPYDTELKILTAKGRELWVRAKGEAEFVNGQCVRLFGTFQDIDEKKKVELELKEVSNRMAIATQAANVGVWEYNVVDNKLVWDDNMYRLYGILKEDFSGVYEAWTAAVHPEDQHNWQRRIQMAISGEREFDTEFRVVWPDGEIRYIRAFAITQRDQDGKAVRMIGTNWDITETRKTENKLKNLVKFSSEQNESLMNFAHIVSHNLRSHSSNLSMLTGFLSKEGNEEEKLKLIQMLEESTESLNETVKHLSEVVQVKTGTSEKRRPVNLKSACQNVEKTLTLLLKEKRTRCIYNIPDSIYINAIPAYLESILLNLYSNSIRYSHPDRDLELKIGAREDGSQIWLNFSDNGLGIDLEKYGDKIFGMYKTFHRHRDAKGIGLFITKNQIDAMNGEITVESKVNSGTTFHLRFEKTTGKPTKS